ncbi:hypothetical protein [Vogesella sp. XCS3]|uniref:hypothetical protein n=1 Tax=Vogesella sp. XCS3 TaxID=2877939 RepID=UPI001D0AA45F|nr:hypothetical protein [Vogesella sp. XCS3]UDM18975.1 hypothetical protein LCH97_18190 [Vogesella sp. XCS3]
MKNKQTKAAFLLGVLALVMVETALAAPVVTANGKSLVDTANQVNNLFTIGQTVLATGLQLLGIACMGFAGWNVYVSGKPGREDRGHMKTAVFGFLGGIIAYFAPNWLGIGAASLL